MSYIDEAKKELTTIIEEVSQYESDIRVIDMVNQQSINKTNEITQNPEYQQLVDMFAFIPADIKKRLKEKIDVDNVHDFEELLVSVSHLFSNELAGVRSWHMQNKC